MREVDMAMVPPIHRGTDPGTASQPAGSFRQVQAAGKRVLNESSRNPVQGKVRGGFLEEATGQSSRSLLL